MTYSDFLIRLTDDGNPAPAAEIECLIEQCRSGEKGRGYFGARKAGSGWKKQIPGGPVQYAVVFYLLPEGLIAGCVAEVVDRWPKAQRPKKLPPTYAAAASQMESWWTLRDATPIAPDKGLIDIPGYSTVNKTADGAFRGGTNLVTFVGWQFDRDPRHSLCAPPATPGG